MNALTYEQALKIATDRWTVEHEAAHAAAAIVLGIGVKEVRVVDIPEKGTLGIVHFEHIELTPEVVRKRAMITLAGPLGERKPGWPPPWPPLEDAEATHDESQLRRMSDYLQLDAKGWRDLCMDARKLTCRKDFIALEHAIGYALERFGGALDAEQLQTLVIEPVNGTGKKGGRMPSTRYKEFAAIRTDTEAPGSFVALASTWEVDRQNERVMPGAFRASLETWRQSGHTIPVMSDHGGGVATVVGHVDPRLSTETSRGLEVTGVLDTSTELGARVYKLVKDGTLRWSIGFIVSPGGRRKAGEITELTEVELVELSAVPIPANDGVRTLSIKSQSAVQFATFEC